MESFEGFELVTAETELTDEQKRKARELISTMPIVALLDHLGRYPRTVEELITSMFSIRDYLRAEMNEHADTKNELNEIKADLRSAGRVLKLMQEVSA